MASRIGSLAVILLLTSALAWNQERSAEIARPSQPFSEPSVSIARLRVPRKALSLYEKAIKSLRDHRYLESQSQLDQALHLYPDFPEALTMRGYTQLKLNQWESAEQSLKAAIRSDPTYGVAYLILSHLYNTQGRFDDALEIAQRAIVPTPYDWLVPYEMCRSFMEKHKYAMALNTSDAALRTTRGTLLHVAKAHALIGLGRYPEAAAELRIYLSYQPQGEGSQDAHNLLDRLQNANNQEAR